VVREFQFSHPLFISLASRVIIYFQHEKIKVRKRGKNRKEIGKKRYQFSHPFNFVHPDV
jgi:hypothetical protein